ncbi:hypothetical protein TCELL_0762 [Thermogladius calderae 1633]|uniref:Uncharacterized protein n=1 Tax=Thermogladius calderae (strain DSM 22663 / VKM B-2946 / 1633) TaxID=1184251 RepID=I3TEJ8_THEC1|nr:hypothetical protein [Thermogladius calderae]AFK51186.1 hypothetical protein TCELL_0762 [Thermogladius calderae 1633]
MSTTRVNRFKKRTSYWMWLRLTGTQVYTDPLAYTVFVSKRRLEATSTA